MRQGGNKSTYTPDGFGDLCADRNCVSSGWLLFGTELRSQRCMLECLGLSVERRLRGEISVDLVSSNYHCPLRVC